MRFMQKAAAAGTDVLRMLHHMHATTLSWWRAMALDELPLSCLNSEMAE